MKNDTKVTIYAKHFMSLRSKHSNPRFMFDYVFKPPAIDGFLKRRVNTG